MSESSRLKVLDFHRPRRPSVEAWRTLSAWHRRACAVAREQWGSLLARPVTVQPGEVEPMQYQHGLSALPEQGLGVQLTIGENFLPSLLVFSAEQIQGLIADLLDLPGESWPEPKGISSVERAMLELLFQKLAEAIGEAWPGEEPLPCAYIEMADKPQRTRLFRPGSPFFVCHLTIQSRFGESPCFWLMPKEETEDLILEGVDPEQVSQPQPHPALQSLTERIPVSVIVELGRVELPMSQVAMLSVGDVLLLDQPVHKPLTARVEDQFKWTGSPLRIGSRQAFEITHPIETGVGTGWSAETSRHEQHPAAPESASA
jgi:flagellar motor switch protein FliM